MQPSQKSPAIENLLEKMTGRTTAIKGNRCIPAPIGCGGSADTFTDNLSRREYTISGMCQKCQDSIFNDSEERSTNQWDYLD